MPAPCPAPSVLPALLDRPHLLWVRHRPPCVPSTVVPSSPRAPMLQVCSCTIVDPHWSQVTVFAPQDRRARIPPPNAREEPMASASSMSAVFPATAQFVWALFFNWQSCFAAIPAPVLGTILSPVFGSQWFLGNTYNITYTRTSSVVNVQIYLYRVSTTPGFINFVQTISANTPATGTFSWTVPRV
jgi:hypothetical protein